MSFDELILSLKAELGQIAIPSLGASATVIDKLAYRYTHVVYEQLNQLIMSEVDKQDVFIDQAKNFLLKLWQKIRGTFFSYTAVPGTPLYRLIYKVAEGICSLENKGRIGLADWKHPIEYLMPGINLDRLNERFPSFYPIKKIIWDTGAEERYQDLLQLEKGGHFFEENCLSNAESLYLEIKNKLPILEKRKSANEKLSDAETMQFRRLSQAAKHQSEKDYDPKALEKKIKNTKDKRQLRDLIVKKTAYENQKKLTVFYDEKDGIYYPKTALLPVMASHILGGSNQEEPDTLIPCYILCLEQNTMTPYGDYPRSLEHHEKKYLQQHSSHTNHLTELQLQLYGVKVSYSHLLGVLTHVCLKLDMADAHTGYGTSDVLAASAVPALERLRDFYAALEQSVKASIPAILRNEIEHTLGLAFDVKAHQAYQQMGVEATCFGVRKEKLRILMHGHELLLSTITLGETDQDVTVIELKKQVASQQAEIASSIGQGDYRGVVIPPITEKIFNDLGVSSSMDRDELPQLISRLSPESIREILLMSGNANEALDYFYDNSAYMRTFNLDRFIDFLFNHPLDKLEYFFDGLQDSLKSINDQLYVVIHKKILPSEKNNLLLQWVLIHNDYDLLLFACEHDNGYIAKQSIEKYSYHAEDMPNDDSLTYVDIAARSGSIEVLKYLLPFAIEKIDIEILIRHALKEFFSFIDVSEKKEYKEICDQRERSLGYLFIFDPTMIGRLNVKLLASVLFVSLTHNMHKLTKIIYNLCGGQENQIKSFQYDFDLFHKLIYILKALSIKDLEKFISDHDNDKDISILNTFDLEKYIFEMMVYMSDIYDRDQLEYHILRVKLLKMFGSKLCSQKILKYIINEELSGGPGYELSQWSDDVQFVYYAFVSQLRDAYRKLGCLEDYNQMIQAKYGSLIEAAIVTNNASLADDAINDAPIIKTNNEMMHNYIKLSIKHHAVSVFKKLIQENKIISPYNIITEILSYLDPLYKNYKYVQFDKLRDMLKCCIDIFPLTTQCIKFNNKLMFLNDILFDLNAYDLLPKVYQKIPQRVNASYPLKWEEYLSIQRIYDVAMPKGDIYPLSFAVYINRSLSYLKEIIRIDCVDIFKKNEGDFTALHFATNLNTLDLLLTRAMELNQKNTSTKPVIVNIKSFLKLTDLEARVFVNLIRSRFKVEMQPSMPGERLNLVQASNIFKKIFSGLEVADIADTFKLISNIFFNVYFDHKGAQEKSGHQTC